MRIRGSAGRGALALGAMFVLLGAIMPVQSSAAEPVCSTTGPSGGAYTVNVCLNSPSSADVLTGETTVTASATSSSSKVVVKKLVFTLDGSYLITDYVPPPFQFLLPTDRYLDGAHTFGVYAIMSDGYTTKASPVTVPDVMFSNGVTSPPAAPGSFNATSGSAPEPGRPVVLAAVGDGASGEPNSASVAGLVASWNPNLFLYLGDVYDNGSPSEFYNWYGEGGRFFGQFRSISDPTIGNHEYLADPSPSDGIPQAPGYSGYWGEGDPGQPAHYYSYDSGGWHLISLDANPNFNQTQAGTAQYNWLQQDLQTAEHDATRTTHCTIVYFHQPAVSGGQHGDTQTLAAIWKLLASNGVEMVLSGHDHDYQRWGPIDPAGHGSPDGITEFVVGTGGHETYPLSTTGDARLDKGFDKAPQAYGALKLELNPSGAAFQYQSITGSVLDSGSVPCRDAAPDTAAPTAPLQAQADAVTATRVDLSWTEATDDVGVTGYDVYRQGPSDLAAIPITRLGPVTSYSDRTAAPGTSYTYQVYSRDAAGNLSLVSAEAVTSTASATFQDGFEGGLAGTWTVPSGSAFTTSSEAYSGVTGGRATTTGTTGKAYAYATIPSTSDVYYRGMVKVLSQGPSATLDLMSLQTSTGGALVTLNRSSGGNLQVWNAVGKANLWSSSKISTGVWHQVELHVVPNGGVGTVEAWLDGVRVISSAAQNLGTTGVGRVVLGKNGGGPYDAAFDDVVVDDAYLDAAPDVYAPAAPAGLAATGVNGNRVDLTWTAATDNVGVAGYDVYRDGNLVSKLGAVTSFSDRTTAPASSYNYSVVARDAAGNASTSSDPASVTTPSTVFADGFESGNLGAWTSPTAGMTILPGTAGSGTYAGGYALEIKSSGTGTAYAYRKLDGNNFDIYAKLSLKVLSTSPLTKSLNLLKLQTAGGTSLATLYLGSTRKLQVYDDGGVAAQVLGGTSSNPCCSAQLSYDQWYQVEVHVQLNGTSSKAEVWLDGSPAFSKTMAESISPIGRVQLGEPVSGKTYDALLDSLTVSGSFIP